ncbi:MAG: flap endonuclease [Microthrixaceae bacterium]|nr:flap endonuclease [Microthrixaceae bacterium]MCO5311661.1 flap endonuclease [Microthrixaceae bacterium]
MQVHLVDGTYELFRYFYAPGGGKHLNDVGEEVGAVRSVLRSVTALLEDGATHVGVATDHVIESFRNELYAGYKDGSGIDPVLFGQFPLLEAALEAAGCTVWAMVEFEADDALGAAAAVAAADPDVTRALICTPDKDLAQCVVDPKVAQFDRRAGVIRDEAAVLEKFGVMPASIPDWLGLVGDTADGFPGLAGWGAKSAAAVLRRYEHIENIPLAPGQWDITVRGSQKLCSVLAEHLDDALLFRTIATIRLDVPVGTPAQWRWSGVGSGFDEMCDRLDAHDVHRRLTKLAGQRFG